MQKDKDNSATAVAVPLDSEQTSAPAMRADLGVDGNAGFALLGENLQEGEAEFVEIDLPLATSSDPKRYYNSEWCAAAKRASTKAYRKLKERLPDRQFSYFLGESHPDFLP